MDFLQGAAAPDEIPNAETLAAFEELDNGGGEWFNGSTQDYIAKLLEDEIKPRKHHGKTLIEPSVSV